MFSPFQLAIKYLQYFLRASNGKGHGTHSPFVFDFITKVLNDKTNYSDYEQVEALRRQLKANTTVLGVEDFGAGSVTGAHKNRTVASIAKNAAKPAKYGQLLYRMVRHYRPGTVLELGTSLGITSAYLALADPEAKVISMEGAPAIAAAAGKNLQQLGIKNLRQVEGNFDSTLPALLQEWVPGTGPGLVFIDGNHREEPTLRYFRQLLPHIQNDTILVFDDIHWSREMEKAWQQVQEQEAVRCTIDLFFIGIVVFRNEFREKQHFTIRF